MESSEQVAYPGHAMIMVHSSDKSNFDAISNSLLHLHRATVAIYLSIAIYMPQLQWSYCRTGRLLCGERYK